MKSAWETHNGKRIFCGRFDHMNVEEVRAEVAAIRPELNQEPDGSVLMLVDPQHTFMSPETVSLFQNVAKDTMPKLRRVAVVGATGLKAIAMDTIMQFLGQPKDKIKPFSDEASAKDWLAS